MYQPAQLDGFIKLLVCHLENIITQGEQLLNCRSDILRLDLLQNAIELGDEKLSRQNALDQQHDNETLFALQLSQSREWVDRLGQLDPNVERETDEFLAATFSIEKLLRNRQSRKDNYHLENILTPQQNNCALRGELSNYIDIEAMLCSIFELLGRLEEQYDLIEELLEQKQCVNGVPFGQKYHGNQSAKIIPLFATKKKRARNGNNLS